MDFQLIQAVSRDTPVRITGSSRSNALYASRLHRKSLQCHLRPRANETRMDVEFLRERRLRSRHIRRTPLHETTSTIQPATASIRVESRSIAIQRHRNVANRRSIRNRHRRRRLGESPLFVRLRQCTPVSLVFPLWTVKTFRAHRHSVRRLEKAGNNFPALVPSRHRSLLLLVDFGRSVRSSASVLRDELRRAHDHVRVLRDSRSGARSSASLCQRFHYDRTNCADGCRLGGVRRRRRTNSTSRIFVRLRAQAHVLAIGYVYELFSTLRLFFLSEIF